MSGVDIFIAILCGVMLFGGLYLNFVSRRLVDRYNEEHKDQAAVQNSAVKGNVKPAKGR